MWVIILECKYWKVICRYGHVGRSNEVSVARYIRTGVNCTIIDAMKIASCMPGVKGDGVVFIQKIDKINYEIGKSSESNFYL